MRCVPHPTAVGLVCHATAVAVIFLFDWHSPLDFKWRYPVWHGLPLGSQYRHGNLVVIGAVPIARLAQRPLDDKAGVRVGFQPSHVDV